MARTNLTAGEIASFKCPPGKVQAFLWDSKTPGLGLRVTSNGGRAYVFQSRLQDGPTARMTIGDPATWSIPAAQAEARRLQVLIDQGKDPRAEKAATAAAHAAVRAAAKVERQRMDVVALDAWREYCAERHDHWGERSRGAHADYASPGGARRKRAKEPLTKPGPLYPLLSRPLASIDAQAVEQWVVAMRARPATAAHGFRLLRAFINWCAEHADYQSIVHADACASRKTRERLGAPRAKSDALQREQLQAWFKAVRQLPPAQAAYLQGLLLTGARREELLSLRWEDVDFQWKALRIRDKVDGERVIPLTPYVAQVISFLPRRNAWVFASPTSASGRLIEPRIGHKRALAAAGLPHLTLHGLRRSFGTLSEWTEAPVGVVAQIQGHKPSAIAEKHYRVRPLDLLRLWHERIEAWILTEASIEQPKETTKPLHVVTQTSASR